MATMTPPSMPAVVGTADGKPAPISAAAPTPWSVDLSDVSRAIIPLVGGKGANLGEMLRAELPVPPGFVLTVAAYERMRASHDLGARIDTLLRTVNPEDPAALQRVSAELGEMITSVPLPHELS